MLIVRPSLFTRASKRRKIVRATARAAKALEARNTARVETAIVGDNPTALTTSAVIAVASPIATANTADSVTAHFKLQRKIARSLR